MADFKRKKTLVVLVVVKSKALSNMSEKPSTDLDMWTSFSANLKCYFTVLLLSYPSCVLAEVEQLERKKIGTPGVHVSTARESASVGDVTRLNVANVVRFSLNI